MVINKLGQEPSLLNLQQSTIPVETPFANSTKTQQMLEFRNVVSVSCSEVGAF